MTPRRLCLFLAALIAPLLPAAPAGAVGENPVTVILRSTPNPSAVGEQVTISVEVTGSAGAVPSGTMTFTSNGTSIGAVALDGTGKASLNTVFNSAGKRELGATYPGDGVYAAGAATTRTQTVETTLSRKTWVGGSGTNWSTAANWSPAAAPVNGDTVVIANAHSGTMVDIPNLTIAHLSFVGVGSAYEGTGVSLGVTGSITADGTNSIVVQTPVVLSAGQHAVDGELSFTRALSGAGGLDKTGPGTVSLTADNSYTGATVVKRGVLHAGAAGALGAAGAGTTVSSGGLLRIGNATVAEPLTLAGDGLSDGTGALAGSGSSSVASGTVALTGSRVSVGSAGQLRVTGVVSGSSKLRKLGAGTVTLEAANTYTGGTEVSVGTLATKHGSGFGPGAIAVGANATLALAGVVTVPNAVSTAANASLSVVGVTVPNKAELSGPITLGGTMLLAGDSGGYLSLSGVISGTGPLMKVGDSGVYLDGATANTYTGGTSVSSGSLVASKDVGPAVTGNLTISGSFGLDGDDQIPDNAAVSLINGGWFSGGGWTDTVGSFSKDFGGIELGTVESDGAEYFGVITTGSLNITGGYFIAHVQGDTPWWEHDQFVVNGPVTLGGSFQVEGVVPPGQTVTLINKTTPGPITGTFNYPEGSTVPTDNGGAIVSYKGGDGNDMTLTGPPARSGYWMLGADGKVYPFGDAQFYGDVKNRALKGTPVDIEPAPDFMGYWILTTAGEVFAFGTAMDLGNATASLQRGETATSISTDGYWNYWIFTSKGRAIDFGDAGHYKDMAGVALNGPVLGSVATPSGEGYYMVASDGGIFAFGDAGFRGSMGGKPLNGPVVGMAPDPDNDGYWQVANDGGIFAFGAGFRGSMGGKPLNRPVVGMVAYGNGYLMVASDGGIFSFSDKPFKGSLGANPPASPIVAVAPLNE